MDLLFATKFLGALFAIMNPFLVLPIFLSMTADRPVAEQRGLALAIFLYTTVMCVVISLAGGYIISFFGVTIDAFRVAGGLVLLGIAFSMLNGQRITSHERAEHEKPAEGAGTTPGDGGDDDGIAFYPMTFPMIVGPGTIATLIIYSAQVRGAAGIASFGVVLAVVLLALFVTLFFAGSIGRLLSVKMRVVMTRLMGMILASIAVEMVFDGAKVMMPGLG